jgi:hypothetical protein
MIEGKLTGNFGKLFTCSLFNAVCQFEVKEPAIFDRCTYILLTFDRANQANLQTLQVSPGNHYTLHIEPSGSDILISLNDGKKDCLMASLSRDSISGWGIGVVVRNPGDRAELSATINPK